jgi:hypothetical protein
LRSHAQRMNFTSAAATSKSMHVNIDLAHTLIDCLSSHCVHRMQSDSGYMKVFTHV